MARYAIKCKCGNDDFQKMGTYGSGPLLKCKKCRELLPDVYPAKLVQIRERRKGR